jgi:hypothetical protein
MRTAAAVVTIVLAGAGAAVAAAARPARNATYVGTVAGKTVTVKISHDRTRGRYTFDCGASGGPVRAWIGLWVKKDGSFAGYDTVPYGGHAAIDSLKGRFTSRKVASAKLSLSLCDGKGGTLTLTRK